MTRLAILIVVLLVLAGAGGAGWWFLLRAAPGEDAAAAEPDKGGHLGATERIDLEPIVLPLLRQGRVARHLTLVLVVELARPLPAEKVQRLTPRLRDSLISELHGIFAFRHVQEHGSELPVVQSRMVLASERVLGPGAVRAVRVMATSERAPGVI